MISRELLSEVLGTEIHSIQEVDHNNDLWYTLKHSDRETINIYELAHKCKEWAKVNGYMLESSNINECKVYPKDKNGFILKLEIEFIENTETESIFKACEYILKESKNA